MTMRTVKGIALGLCCLCAAGAAHADAPAPAVTAGSIFSTAKDPDALQPVPRTRQFIALAPRNFNRNLRWKNAPARPAQPLRETELESTAPTGLPLRSRQALFKTPLHLPPREEGPPPLLHPAAQAVLTPEQAKQIISLFDTER